MNFKRILKKPFNFFGLDVVKLKEHCPTPKQLVRADLQKIPNSGKVFGIGYNKTGTTSLNRLMADLGFDVAPQVEQELLLTDGAFSGDYSNFNKFISKYEFFQDLPFSQGYTFVACDALFPNSKFILTIRDEDSWFRSMLNFHRKVFKFEAKEELSEAFFKGKNLYLTENYVYENKKRTLSVVDGEKVVVDWSLLYDEDHYKAIYRKRNADVLRYFSDRPESLLVIDLTKEKSAQRVVDFLGVSTSAIPSVPHENKT